MKRLAETQITKDSADRDDEDSDSGSQVGFQKADDTVLATRKIKGLPKRASTVSASASPSSTTQSTSPQQPAPSKFSGFAGFGVASTSSFNFTSTPPNTMSSDQPVVAPTASNAAKVLSSFLSNPSPSQNPSPLAPAPTIEEPSADETAAKNYYLSLRGLNISFLSSVQKAVEDDPFVDVAALLEGYKTHRGNVQQQFDSTRPNATSPAPLSRIPTQPVIPSMPTPPTTFSGFSFPQKSTSGSSLGSSETPALGGFTPTASNGASSKSTASPFSFPSTTTASSSSPFSNSSTSAAPSGFTFAKPATDSKASESTAPTSVFGTKSDTPAKTGGFTFTNPAASTTSGGAPLATSSNPFGAPKPNPFGAPSVPSSFPSSSSTSSSTSPKPASPFGGFGGFGAKTPTSPGGGGGSIGNPVGFGFGAASKDASSSSGFTFGGSTSPKKTEEDVVETKASEAEDKDKKEGGLEGSSTLFGNSPHDEEGEGEEDEETTHSIRLKAFRLKKADEGAVGWADLGTGVLRLKKHKESGARRVLLRNSSTGKIIINFNLYGGLKPSQAKKTVMFVGHEGATSQTYNVRMKTEEQAAELKNALDREIAFVKAKSDA